MVECNKELFVKLLCEILASLFVQFFGCSFGGAAGTAQQALAWGGGVLGATQAFRIISGAHINPCISIAAMIVQNVEIVEGILYIICQVLGSAFGFGIAYSMVDKAVLNEQFCLAKVRLIPWKACLLEFFMTGAWVFAMCASWNPANEGLLDSISLRIGFVVVVCHLVGVSFQRKLSIYLHIFYSYFIFLYICAYQGLETGCSMNPFRALWPAVVANNWEHIYVPIAIPLVTAILLPIAWRFLYTDGKSGGE